MGRKRRGGGPEALPRLVPLLQLLLSVFLGGASGYRNVGCVFNKSVCKPEVEYCFRDQVFGRCVQFDAKAGDFDDFYRYNLTPDQLELLRVQLEQLEYEGYNWLDYYTQCVMKILLDDLRYGTVTDVAQLCHHLKLRNDNILDDENEFIVKDVGSMKELEPVATVKFTPSRMNPHGEFADEFYYPTEVRQRMEEERRKNNRFDDDYDGSVYDKLGAIGNPDEVYRRGSRSLTKKSQGPSLSKPYTKDNYGMQQEYLEALVEFLNRRDDDDDNDDNDNDNDDDDDDDDEATDTDDGVENETEDDYDDEDDNEDAEDFENTSIRRKPIIQNGIIIPVGRDVMRTPKVYDDLPLGSNFDDTIWRREIAGFKRRERLDVKKPGPPFSTNNYAFKVESSSVPDDENNDEDMQDNDVIYLPQVKKEIYNSKLSTSPKTYESVDLDYVYIQFNQEFHSWSEGERVVNLVGSLIGLQPGELKDIRVGRAEVTFKVPKNSKNYNATYIVHKIADSIIDDLHKQLNIDVVRAGIGDKAKLPAILEVTSVTEINSRVFGAWVAAGVAAVSAAAVVILIIARRHAKSRAKLAGVRTPDPEASKDYQDLCRARMQAKQSDKVNESPKAFDFGRLIESGRSESNRSSTSSWSEEPQVTNMDIATGHVVLSYMEDHLKNQDKLDEEWAALCAYEAEPCSTAVAEAEGNAECNRPGAALPYDHSRVILNDLANLNNSDYINASTITDHDPRNPAYIATQGPLPQTTADFWQLVWEQGSVVIVMLTRLTEEGQAMCHRYWPEEGSELYHIYEVHLVSELIWCEDYLVRSFYLKNLRTGETRTVTQFHFLSWSQNGVPQSTKALLEFRRKVNKSYRGRSCPIIVHCSDGAGRTGTYCLIDMVLNRMAKGTKEIDIAATLEHIRDQRADMVATKQQFEFVLIAVAEEVHAILKSLPIVAEKSTTTALSSTNASANKSNASSQSATQSDK